ncbi:hypothetical protein MKX03_034088, partial [Papaver bracteatum]
IFLLSHHVNILFTYVYRLCYGVVRVCKLDNVWSPSFKFLKIPLPAGGQPTAVAFSEASVVVAAQYSSFHQTGAIVTLAGTTASYDTSGGSPFIVSCSEGSDIILWNGKSGKILGTLTRTSLKTVWPQYHPPNGKLIASAAASSADVKIWEIIFTKAGSVKEITGVMQLKGHESAVTWLCFSSNSEQIITASKDGTIKIVKVFPIPLHDLTGATLHYDHLDISPDGKILAATHCRILQWLCAETGKVLNTDYEAHAGEIMAIAWAPKKIRVGRDHKTVFATAGPDKRVKLWVVPVDPPHENA